MTPPPFERRRAEDVYKVVEDEIYPRLKVIDGEISDLRKGVNKLALEGCAHRTGDLLRTQVVEESMGRIFEKIDDFGEKLSTHQVDVTKQIGGIRSWVLGGVLAVAVALLVFFAVDYANDLNRGIGKTPVEISNHK